MPTLGRVTQTGGDPHRARPYRPARCANEGHAGLGRGASTFPPITADTRGRDVLPDFPSTVSHRDDMIERQCVDCGHGSPDAALGVATDCPGLIGAGLEPLDRAVRRIAPARPGGGAGFPGTRG